MDVRGRSAFGLLVFGFCCLCLSGCGSDSTGLTGTTGTISGVAAAGAPIMGTVTIKDSNSTGIEKQVEIAPDGSYSINIYGLTPPFALRADGLVGSKQYHLHSVATAADINGTVNITPFTDLVVANMAGKSGDSYYRSSGFKELTAAAIQTAQEALRDKLHPLFSALVLSDGTDLLHTPFKADHTGIDSLLDIIKVRMITGTFTAILTNIVSQETITNDYSSRTYSSAFTDTSKITQAVAGIRAIVAQLRRYSNLFATSLPSPTDPQLLALFDSETFRDKGRDLGTFISKITSNQHRIGISTDVIVDAIDPVAGTAVVEPIPIRKGGYLDQENPKRYIMKNGVWLDQGDGWIGAASVSAEAAYHINTDPIGSPVFQIGFSLYIQTDDPNIFSAVITGPGLPDSGYKIYSPNFGYERYYRFENDVDILLIPENAVYTVHFYDSDNNLMGTCTQNLPKRPPTFAELSGTAFPTIAAQTRIDLYNFNTEELQVSWTLTQGLFSDSVLLTQFDSTFDNSSYLGQYLDGDVTSALLRTQPVTDAGVHFTPAYRRFALYAKDRYGRWFDTYLWAVHLN